MLSFTSPSWLLPYPPTFLFPLKSEGFIILAKDCRSFAGWVRSIFGRYWAHWWNVKYRIVRQNRCFILFATIKINSGWWWLWTRWIPSELNPLHNLSHGRGTINCNNSIDDCQISTQQDDIYIILIICPLLWWPRRNRSIQRNQYTIVVVWFNIEYGSSSYILRWHAMWYQDFGSGQPIVFNTFWYNEVRNLVGGWNATIR
jgi:hypothetical protein